MIQIFFSKREKFVESDKTIRWLSATAMVPWHMEETERKLKRFFRTTDAVEMSAVVPEFFREHPVATLETRDRLRDSTSHVIHVDMIRMVATPIGVGRYEEGADMHDVVLDKGGGNRSWTLPEADS